DQVVHPKHGAGKIVGVEQLELIEGFENYYVIEMEEKRLTVRVPFRKMEALNIRPVMSPSRLQKVLNTLHDAPRRLATDYKTRQARLREKLGTGRPSKIAEVVRDLTWHKRNKTLASSDARLLDHGREVLTTEIALVTDTEPTEARQIINTVLVSDDDDQEIGVDALVPSTVPTADLKALTRCPNTDELITDQALVHYSTSNSSLRWWLCPACQGWHTLTTG
ncbi:MAG: CarD family transcriptional regulator, partial [Anaerolineae bacterium]|nr:CarD family transcriptional regulator [Anaerolineae bacterium]